MRVGTWRPSQVMALVPGSRVTSARNGSPSTVPSWSDWVTWAMGNRGLVISVGREKAGVARSTRWLSGASGRQPLPFSCLTQVAAAAVLGVRARRCRPTRRRRP